MFKKSLPIFLDYLQSHIRPVMTVGRRQYTLNSGENVVQIEDTPGLTLSTCTSFRIVLWMPKPA